MKIFKSITAAVCAVCIMSAGLLGACFLVPSEEQLDTPVVTVSAEAYLSWNVVKHATEYELTVNGATTTLTDTYYQAEADRDFTFSLIARAEGYKNSEAATGSYTARKPEPVPTDGYHFDSRAEDGGNGSKEKPFNSLLDFNKLTLEAGDAVLFKNGSEFRGEFKLSSIEGTAQKPIVITNYGEGDRLPKFNGVGVVGSGVVAVENCSYLTVKNLEIFDTTKTEGDRRGVLLTADSDTADGFYTSTGITLEGLYIHDIRGEKDAANSGMSLASKKTGGIQVWSENGRGRFDKLTVKDCVIRNVDNVGIATWYRPGTAGSAKVSPYTEKFNATAHTNVVISGNDISDIGKNAIFARNLKGGLIERNVMHDTAVRCVSGNTICTSYVYGTVIQYNEGYLNRAQKRPSDGAVQDGCMLDADLQSRDTVWQYNYSHDNAFGLFLNCTSYAPDSGVLDRATVRYNLSVNDYGNKGIVFINYAAAMIEVYNNTIVTGADTSPIILQSNNGDNRNYSFYNNIIYNCSAEASLSIPERENASFSDNLVYNTDGADIANVSWFGTVNTGGKYVDPLFAGKAGASVEARTGMNAAQAFKLSALSPALNAGRAVSGVKSDFFGNAYKKSIGCYCG